MIQIDNPTFQKTSLWWLMLQRQSLVKEDLIVKRLDLLYIGGQSISQAEYSVGLLRERIWKPGGFLGHSSTPVVGEGLAMRVNPFDSSSSAVVAEGLAMRVNAFDGSFLGKDGDLSSQVKAIRNSTCDECGKIFADSKSKSNHKRAVHDKRPFSCVCGKEYKYMTGLRMHKKKCACAKMMRDDND
ncbi:zinc finger protein 58-like isoform X37 [Haliotis rufescens]|uniref:zinc finger protein 58-like isoform X37 n=1 Tax=Haliotis rufescens TaxID=6454 RepID=UPI001EB0154E|nr:zinc finger protein 58-like isoform X37 [Haliotis rufescens]